MYTQLQLRDSARPPVTLTTLANMKAKGEKIAALTIPHPGIVDRNWVLYPLADIAPSLDIPGVGRVADLKGSIAPEGLWTL